MTTHANLPEQFGRYRILRTVGEGGMGTVYLAEDTRLSRHVALKVPRFREDDGPELIDRFYREARMATGIEHPNLCPVYEVGEVDGIHYLTMPFVEGTPLAKIAKEPWPPHKAVELLRQLAVAVGVIHQRGVIHRDIKPGNVLVRPSGEPVLMDFGLARTFGTGAGLLTATGVVLGTPAYMSPEQVRAQKTMGPATDVYSLGVILYMLLTGQRPFQVTLAAVYRQVLHVMPQPPSTLVPGLDSALDALCLKAMAKKPEDRYPTGAEFAAALQAYQEGRGGPAAPLPARAPASDPNLTRVLCRGCGRRIKVPANLLGKKVKCPACQTVMTVATEPPPAAAPPPVPVPAPEEPPTESRAGRSSTGLPAAPSEPTRQPIAGPTPRPAPRRRRKLWLVAGLGGLLLLVALVLLGWLLWPWR